MRIFCGSICADLIDQARIGIDHDFETIVGRDRYPSPRDFRWWQSKIESKVRTCHSIAAWRYPLSGIWKTVGKDLPVRL